MNNLSLIACLGPNRELGNDNKLLWHLKDDLAFYKEITLKKKNIIMGRVTLESMPSGALKNRNALVLSRKPIQDKDNIKYFTKKEDILNIISNSSEEYIVIGGAMIYEEFLPYIETMYLTHVETDKLPNADTYFPDFCDREWNIVTLKEGNEKEFYYKIKKYIRKR